MSERRSLFAELKRRNVYRAMVFYAASAWLLVQVATQVFPFFHIAEWVVRWIVIAAIVGFPFWLAFAWFYEFTPEGLKLESEVEAHESIAHLTGKKLDLWIIAIMTVAIVLLLTNTFVWHKGAGLSADSDSAPLQAPAKSIAVLPFESLSEDKANAYFATGMQDEILTRLASIRDLKVISRTSTLKYQSRPEDLRTVGAQLGVASVLEGSVQRAGDAVHISVKLIDARTDNQLWAQSYNRDLKDIFAVEGEVAQSIADALQAHLSPQESARVTAAPTRNAAAYDLYLRGLAHYNRGYDQTSLTTDEMPQAVSLFEQAVTTDPLFAVADALLSSAHMRIYFFAPDRSATRLAAAKATADHALALQPDLGEGHLALALYHYYGHRDYAEATRHLQLARQLQPNNAQVESTLAAVARRQMLWNEAIAGYQKATLLDPRNPLAVAELGRTYQALRHYAEADRQFGLATAIAPDELDGRLSQARNLLLWKGDLGPMRKASDTLPRGSGPYRGNVAYVYSLHWLERDYAGAIETAASNTAAEWNPPGSNIVLPRALYLAQAYLANGDDATARQTYESVQKAVGAALSKQPDSADLHLALGFADAGLGLRDDALREGRRAAELLPASRDALSGTSMLVLLAQLDVRAGDHDAAFDHLRQALALPSGITISSALLQVDPVWNPIRNDPRFAQLLTLAEAPIEIAT